MLIQYKINKIDKVSEVTNAVKVAKEKSINDARKLINDKSTACPKKLTVLYPSSRACQLNPSTPQSPQAPELQKSDNELASLKSLAPNFKTKTQTIIIIPTIPQYHYLLEYCIFAK
ncbi:hypothetical protein NIES2101_37040 [Calothrix sp. HK-06]|nr:hypothetical protein NIES2101_37040 [Calothrix sp. HK-06]